jgi:hypothetical protein
MIVEQSLTFTIEPLAKSAAPKSLLMNVVFIIRQVTHQGCNQRFIPSIMVIDGLVDV